MSIHLDSIYSLLLIFTRAGALLLAVPMLGGVMIPVQVRVALALLVAVVLAPICPAAPLGGSHTLWLLLALVSEIVIGLLMGIAVQAVFSTIEFAASTISTEIGLAQSTAMNPDSGGQSTSLGTLFFFVGVLIFLATRMHHEVLAALSGSFFAIPAGSIQTQGISLGALTLATRQIFIVGVLMAAPFIAVNFLINVTFALLGKVAPKMNVFMTSFPVRIIAGLFVLISTATLLAHYMDDMFHGMAGRMSDLLLAR